MRGPYFAASRPAAMRFGARFHSRSNQSMKISASARRARSRGQSGGSGLPLFDVAEDRHGVGEDEPVVVQHRHELLPAHAHDLAAVVRSAPSIHSTSSPLYPNPSATRSTFVESGIR